MIVTIKNLQSETFTVDCDPNDTVYNLKKLIAEKHQITPKYEADLIKLLYIGKIMEDEEIVRDFDIKSDSFLVLVRQRPGKPKPPPKKKKLPFGQNAMGAFGNDPFMSSPFKTNAFGQMSFAQHSLQPNHLGHGSFGAASLHGNSFGAGGFGSNSFSMNQFTPDGLGASSFPSTAGFGQGGHGASSLLKQNFDLPSSSGASAASHTLADTSPEAFSTPEDRANALEQLLGMGFDKTQSEQALRACFYNVESAVELITSNKISKAPTSTAVPPPRPAGATGMGTNIQELQKILQNNPEQLQLVKDAVKAQHPELAQLIENNPQAFLQLLNQATASNESEPTFNPSQAAAGVPSAQTGSAITVTLSTYEQEIIQRLQDMGFERNHVIEAYLACERNEDLAVNYLLSTNE